MGHVNITKKRWIASAATVLTLSLAASGCGVAGSANQNNNKKGPLLIGTVQALSGPFGPVGQDTLHGLQAEVNLLNQRGGILGRKVKVISVDDNSSAQQAVSATQQMLRSHHLDAFMPDTVLASSQLPLVKNIFTVNMCSLALCGDGSTYPYTFTVNPPTVVQVPPMLAYAQKNNLGKTVILAQNTSEGQEFVKETVAAEKKRGMPVSPTVYYSATATDITPQLQKARSMGAQALYVWATGSGPSVVARGMQNLGWDAPIIGVSVLFTGPIQTLVPKSMWSQVVCLCYATGMTSGGQVPSAMKPLVGQLQKVGGVHSLLVAALGADVGSAIAYGFTKAGSTDTQKAASALAQIGADKNFAGQGWWTYRHVNPGFHDNVHSPLDADLSKGFFAVMQPSEPTHGAFPGHTFNFQ